MKKILYMSKLEPHKDFHHLPVSVLSVAAVMDNVSIYDERVDNESKFFDALRTDTEAVMFSVFTGYQLTQAYKRSKWLKENFPRIKIVWGGPHASTMPEQTLASPYVDEVVQGDLDTGEHPLPYHLIDVERYVNPATERFMAISSYGCVGNCTFCQTAPRRKLKFLPFERVEADIDNLMRIHKFKQAVLFDATVFTRPERALFIAGLMKKHGLKWICDARADEICRTPKDVLEEIMKSGLMQITVGLESGSPRIVELMQKGKYHLQKYEQMAEIMRGYDVRLVSGVIFGCPSEGPEDIKQTVEYIGKIKHINPNFRISSTFYKPLPNTIMAGMAAEYGYRQPQTLQEWAEQGESGHYHYNEWESSPWIVGAEEYREAYEAFKNERKELFI